MDAPLVHFRFTADEYEQMIATGILTEDDRVELLEGEIIAMSPIGDEVVFSLNSLAELLFEQLRGRAVVSMQNPIRLDAHSRPQPDIALWRRRSRRSLPGPEDILLLVEISDSTLGSDRLVKIPLYARAGISEVWLVNLIDENVEIYRQPQDDMYRSTQTATQGESISPSAFPDMVVPIDAVLG